MCYDFIMRYEAVTKPEVTTSNQKSFRILNFDIGIQAKPCIVDNERNVFISSIIFVDFSVD